MKRAAVGDVRDDGSQAVEHFHRPLAERAGRYASNVRAVVGVRRIPLELTAVGAELLAEEGA